MNIDVIDEAEFTRRLKESRKDRANGVSEAAIKAKYFTRWTLGTLDVY